MSTVSASVPAYFRSKLRPYFAENSLIFRVLDLPSSVLNIVNTKGKNSLLVQAYNYSTWMISKIWHVASWRNLRNKELSKDKEKDDSKLEMASKEDVIFDDYSDSNFTFSCLKNIYLHFLEHNFLGITRESLELLRYERKVLQNLQDFEVVKTLQGLLGCQSSDEQEDENKTQLKASRLSFTNLKNVLWTATAMAWTALYNRISCYLPVWVKSSSKKDDPGLEKCTDNPKLENNSKEITPNCSKSTSNAVSLSAGSLLLCESNLLTKVLADSGTYALTSTHDLLKDSLLLFVPMEILENTTELLKHPTSFVLASPLSAFAELYNYASMWGLDILDECCNQPDIEYAVIDDDDFHFVVNVPKMRRPILFIGIR